MENLKEQKICYKSIVFDTGPIISLTLNNLNWLIEPLKEKYGGEFFITPAVYGELIERPLSTKKYKFEALQNLPYLIKGIIKNDARKIINIKANELINLANKCFRAQDNYIQIVHIGEMEALACAIFLIIFFEEVQDFQLVFLLFFHQLQLHPTH